MTHVIDRKPVDAAVATLLESVCSFPIGRSKAPSKDGDIQDVAEPPYAIVYAIVGGNWWGPGLATREDAATLIYQITSVGLREDQATWAGDKVRQALVGRDDSFQYEHSITVPGVSVVLREVDGPPGAAIREGKIWSMPERYAVKVSLR